MKRQKRKMEKPLKPFDRERIEAEKNLLFKYGLRRKREIWTAHSMLRNFRRIARELLAKKDKEKESRLINKLIRIGLIAQDADLDDVLTLTVENILDRRLQTIVFKKGLARTLKHARQMIVHGHIAVDGRRARYPSMLVDVEDENKISIYGQKPKTEIV